MPRNANWHETGGNAAQLKGSEEQTLTEHARPQIHTTNVGRGAASGGQPGHAQALYSRTVPRRRK